MLAGLLTGLSALAAPPLATVDTLSPQTHEERPLQFDECGPGFRALKVEVDLDPTKIAYNRDIVVIREDGSSTEYARTNRGIDDYFRKYKTSYPQHWYESDAFRGQTVLDGATGGGKFVTDLIAEGHKAEGFDIAVSRQMLDDPRKPFFVADFLKIPKPDQTYTLIYLQHGPFEYCKESPAFYRAAFQELRRVLKPGGKIRIVPIQRPSVLYNVLFDMPGLSVTDRPPPDWTGGPYLEITRVP